MLRYEGQRRALLIWRKGPKLFTSFLNRRREAATSFYHKFCKAPCAAWNFIEEFGLCGGARRKLWTHPFLEEVSCHPEGV